MPPNKQNTPGNFPPSTREAEYRIIIHKVNEVCVTIRKFAKTYFDRKAVDYSQCSKCLNEILNDWGCDVSQFKTWKEFSEKLKIKDVKESVCENEHYTDLLYIFERAKRFEVMIPGVREQMVKLAKDHVYRYCQSFVDEIGSLDVRPVFDYDEAIKAYKKDIDAKIDQVNSNILTYGDMKTPFDKFVAEGNVHGTLMEDICVLIVEISHLMKKWVSDDASYPEKLLQEVFFNNSYKEKLDEDIVKLHEKRREAEHSLERKQKHHNQLTRYHGNYKKKKRKLKKSLETVNNKIEKLSFEIKDKHSEISSLQNTLGDKTPRSHREKGELNLKIEKTETFVERVEEWRSVMERQKLRLERELKTVSDRTYELKVEGVTVRHEADEVRNSILGVDIEIKSIHERIASIDEKTVLLKRIRVLKLSPDTLRKMHKRKSPTNTSKVMAGNLEEACRFVAQYIGRDWKILYNRLPFIPPRDSDRRTRDVAVIDQISARRDKTPEESALTSLEKWRSFNRHGDVSQLIKGLRKVHKVDLAQKLETRYMTGDVYA